MKGTQIDMKKKRFATIVAALLVISLVVHLLGAYPPRLTVPMCRKKHRPSIPI